MKTLTSDEKKKYSFLTFKRTIERNKRNYRKQETHLKIARGTKETLKELGEMNPEGRPVGSGTKEELVKEYIEKNPEDNPTEISKALNISRTTVYKYI